MFESASDPNERGTPDATPAIEGHVLNQVSYNAIAPRWDGARHTLSGREPDYLAALVRDLKGPARILDLGCGTGRPIAEHLLLHGYTVTGVDQAEALLALARQRFPQATWIEGALERFESDTRFDAIVCWDAVFHVDRSLHEALFDRFASMLSPGGRVMLTVGGSAHPAFIDTMFGERFFYDSHPPAVVLAMLASHGLHAEIAEFMNVPTGGRDKGRYAIVATRR
jgi:2-polyprenyl-3-methyl-5-hydroxy-6-metoxy-1,4-benzoquinol methylase